MLSVAYEKAVVPFAWVKAQLRMLEKMLPRGAHAKGSGINLNRTENIGGLWQNLMSFCFR